MALSIPSFPNPFDPANPIKNAYVYISGIALDTALDVGRITLNVHPSEAAWQSPPMAQISVALGQVFIPANPGATPPVAEDCFPRLDELMADPAFAQAFATLGAKLYAALLAKDPTFAGASVA